MTEATNGQALREVDEVEAGSTYKCQQGPWNPGIKSQLPRTLLPMCTVFRPENVYTTLAAAEELRDFTGMELHDLVTFKPERLVVHELLVRVTADIAVSDGSQYEDLGINFRRITQTILTRYVEPQMPALKSAYNEFRARTLAIVEREVAHVLDAAQQPVVHSEAPPSTGFRAFMSLFRRAPKANAGPSKLESRDDREAQAIARWQLRSSKATDPTEAAACHSLAVVATAIRSRHGCLWGDGSLLARLACDLACNDRGSVLLGELIEPHVLRAVESEGFDLLPGQAKPVVMNTKGASASGKSTMRPMQKRLSNKIGVRWRDFALISPDIWRKFLLDYASLGDAFKYSWNVHRARAQHRRRQARPICGPKGACWPHVTPTDRPVPLR